MLSVVSDELEIIALRKRFIGEIAAVSREARKSINFPGPLPGYANQRVLVSDAGGFWVFFPEEARFRPGTDLRRYCSYLGDDIRPDTLVPVVEINFGSHRHPTGRLLKDDLGRTFVGHRGRLGGGRTNVGPSSFLPASVEHGFRVATASSSAGRPEDVIVVAELGSPELSRNIGAFVALSRKLRRTAAEGPSRVGTQGN